MGDDVTYIPERVVREQDDNIVLSSSVEQSTIFPYSELQKFTIHILNELYK